MRKFCLLFVENRAELSGNDTIITANAHLYEAELNQSSSATSSNDKPTQPQPGPKSVARSFTCLARASWKPAP